MKKNEITITEEVLDESLENDILKRKKILNNKDRERAARR